MALILSIETTTTNCSVALGKDGKLVGLKEFNSPKYSHSEKLHQFIKEVCQQAEYDLKDLDSVAVSKGPGSYTGLRIGVSAAKGFCFALDIPLIALETLEVVARQITTQDYTYIIPMLDARRMEAYVSVFDKAGKNLSPTSAKILEPDSFSEYLNEKVVFIGNAVRKFEEIYESDQADFKESFPSAKEMVSLAEGYFKQKEFVDVAYFEPYYLKDFMIKN